MAKVYLTSQAKEDLRDLDRSVQLLVFKALKKLEQEPEKRGAPLGSRATGNLTTFRKLVVGNRGHRVIYRVERDGSVCVVWVIAARADDVAYNLAMSRLRLYASDRALARELERAMDEIWAGTES